MGLKDWFKFRSTGGAIWRIGTQQARKFDSTCEFVAQEFIRRNNLNSIPPQVWQSCLNQGTPPAGLTEAVRDLISAHAIEGSKEHAISMVACSLNKLGPNYRHVVAISLIKLIAPSIEKDVNISIGAAAVLAQLVYLEPNPKAAYNLRNNLMQLTTSHLKNDHDYIWMKIEEVSELMNLG